MTEKSKSKFETRGRPRKESSWTSELLQERSQRYFDKCDENLDTVMSKDGELIAVPSPAPYTIEGLCCYLKITVQTFRNWRRRDDSLGEMAQFLHQQITANRIAGALTGKQNPNFAKFLLINNEPEEYKEKIELQQNIQAEVKSILDIGLDSWQNVIKK